MYWSTVRPDGKPQVTPMVALWLDGALYFCTGPTERKAQNLTGNRKCLVTTGCNHLSQGLDVVIEGHAEQIEDEEKLRWRF